MSWWVTVIGIVVLCAAAAPRPAAAQVEVVAKKVTEAPTVDGRPDKVWDGVKATKVTLSEGTQGDVEVSVKALYTDKDIYFFFQWPDKTMSLNRFWEFTGKEWKKGRGNEDRLNVMWDLGTTKEFGAKGCTAACHKLGTKVSLKTGGPDERLDLWVWGAQSSNPLGAADDEWLGPETRRRGSEEVARQPDSEGGPIANWDAEAKRPRYVFKEGAKPGPILLRKDAVDAKDAKPKSGDKVPQVVLDKPQGSRADIEAKGVWDKGRWTLELRRARDTGDKDHDVQFTDPARATVFAISVHDDSAAEEHSHMARAVLKLLLK